MHQALNPEEWVRYDRQLTLNEISSKGQLALKKAKILCAGSGGLANSALPILVNSGIGKIGIIDYDLIELSNLHRQFLFTTADLGKSKVSIAKKRLHAMNPNTKIVTYETTLNQDNIREIAADYDIILDTTDNYETRYLINDYCIMSNKSMCYGSVLQFEGHVTTFSGKQGACLRCLFPSPPPQELMVNCNTAGVFSSLPAIIGSIQATEAIKIILTIGEVLSGRFIVINALNMSFREFILSKDPACPICNSDLFPLLLNNKFYCNQPTEYIDKTISASELLASRNSSDLFLIDVREKEEHKAFNIGGENIPLSILAEHAKKIPFNKEIILYCKKGIRSKKAFDLLSKMTFKKLRYLKGGIFSYIEEELKHKHE